jgi:CRISPR-associated protein Csb2
MITIRLAFPAGRYHATPWGRHVNEGVAEWPPSPYRLLRALYDVWQRKCFDIAEEDVRSVLEALAESPPSFQLPRVVASHTRSYLSANKIDPTDKNLVFDPFLVVERPRYCYVQWPRLELPARGRETVALLLGHLNYLGRSESWVRADLWDGPIEADFEAAPATAEGEEATERVACAVPAAEYRGKSPWMEALTYSTWNLLKQRASAPPLLRSVRYRLPEGAVAVDPPARFSPNRSSGPHAVILGLDSTVLPLVTATLEVAEQVRTRLMGAHKQQTSRDEVSPLFSGKQADGGKRLDHGHVYILPLGNPAGRIDRILLVSRKQPFDAKEMNAVRGVRKLWQADGRPDVRCVVTWQGQLNSPDLFRAREVVQSKTPFVPPRHWRKGRDYVRFIEDEVRRECINHEVPARLLRAESVDLSGPFHESEFRRNRKNDPVRPGCALRLTFDRKVPTPFAIGYGAHFGLGQFDIPE